MWGVEEGVTGDAEAVPALIVSENVDDVGMPVAAGGLAGASGGGKRGGKEGATVHAYSSSQVVQTTRSEWE